jgi:hypothetical protein
MQSPRFTHFWLSYLVGGFVVVAIFTTLFFSRSFLLQAPDVAHLTDLYHHSQWSVPLSTRTISDDQLYLVAGAELAQGAQPFAINPEVPPLGKYLYALATCCLVIHFWWQLCCTWGWCGCRIYWHERWDLQ